MFCKIFWWAQVFQQVQREFLRMTEPYVFWTFCGFSEIWSISKRKHRKNFELEQKENLIIVCFPSHAQLRRI